MRSGQKWGSLEVRTRRTTGWVSSRGGGEGEGLRVAWVSSLSHWWEVGSPTDMGAGQGAPVGGRPWEC